MNKYFFLKYSLIAIFSLLAFTIFIPINNVSADQLECPVNFGETYAQVVGTYSTCPTGSCGSKWCRTGILTCMKLGTGGHTQFGTCSAYYDCSMGGTGSFSAIAGGCDTSSCVPANADGSCGGGSGITPPPTTTSPSFTISVFPTTNSAVNGEMKQYNLSVTPTNSAAEGAYTFVYPIPGCPTGATCEYIGGNTASTGTDTRTNGDEFATPAFKQVRVIPTSATPGTYYLTFSATKNGTSITNSTSASLIVNQSSAPTIIMSAPASSQINVPFTVSWTSTNATWVVTTSSTMPPAGCTLNPVLSVNDLNSSRSVTCSTLGVKGFQIMVGNSSTHSAPARAYVDITATPVMSGTLTAPSSSCVIALGENNCNLNLNWSIANPQGTPTAITANGMTNINVTNTLATPQSGTQSVSVPYGGRTFYLYNNAQPPLAQVPISADKVTCISGTRWSGSSCVVSTAPTIIMSAPASSQINVPFTVSWTSTNATWVVTTSSTMPPAGCTLNPVLSVNDLNSSRSVTCSTLGVKGFQIMVGNSSTHSAPARAYVDITAVSGGGAPTLESRDNKINIVSGDPVDLNWGNADACTATPNFTGGAASGNVTITPSTTTTYAIDCGARGRVSVTINVRRRPVIIEN